MKTQQEMSERIPWWVLETEAALNRIDGTLRRHDEERRLELRALFAQFLTDTFSDKDVPQPVRE